jgi:hypothetical protein
VAKRAAKGEVKPTVPLIVDGITESIRATALRSGISRHALRLYMKAGYTPQEIVDEWRRRPAGTPRRQPLFYEPRIIAPILEARAYARKYSRSYSLRNKLVGARLPWLMSPELDPIASVVLEQFLVNDQECDRNVALWPRAGRQPGRKCSTRQRGRDLRVD